LLKQAQNNLPNFRKTSEKLQALSIVRAFIASDDVPTSSHSACFFGPRGIGALGKREDRQ
jgi:hypothetical protein